MTYKISRCSICGQFFQSKKGLKEHKDRNHRITNSKNDDYNARNNNQARCQERLLSTTKSLKVNNLDDSKNEERRKNGYSFRVLLHRLD